MHEAIRARGDVPVMMLTARGEEQDLVKALELGADDYLTQAVQPEDLAGARQGAAAPRRAGIRGGRRVSVASRSTRRSSRCAACRVATCA